MFRRSLVLSTLVLPLLLTSPLPAEASTRATGFAVSITTCKQGYAGTDDSVQGRVTSTTGPQTSWQEFDKPYYNDFEAGDSDTYGLPASADFGEPASFQLWKGGSDDWCVQSVTLSSPSGKKYVVNMKPTDGTHWITEDEERTEQGNGYVRYWHHEYSPDWQVIEGELRP